jgi:glycosyltransferase involved in cell wall biosynthesis
VKIAHIINTFPGYHKRVGGGEQAALRLIRKLAKNGVENDIYTTKFDLKPEQNEFNVRALPVKEDFAGPLARFVGVCKWYLFQFDPLTFIASYIVFKKTRPNVVHLHNMYVLTFAPLVAARLLNIPVVVSIYDYWYFCPSSTLLDNNGSVCRDFHGTHCANCLPPVFVSVQKAFLSLRRAVFNMFIRKVSRFVALSNSSREILLAYGIKEDKIEIIPVDIPEEFGGQKLSEPKAQNILFIGWLQKRKGLMILLDAMDKVWKEFPGAGLKIITQEVKWEDGYKKLVADKLKTIDSSRYEYISGQVSRPEIKKSLEESAVVVIPEQWENMSPLLVIEAMFMSKAIVASDIGGIPEFIEDGATGLLFKFNDPQMLAEKIKVLLKNAAVARELGENARGKISELLKVSAPHIKMMELYRKLGDC